MEITLLDSQINTVLEALNLKIAVDTAQGTQTSPEIASLHNRLSHTALHMDVINDVLNSLAWNDEITVNPFYSGRGMYGSTCLSVSGSRDALTRWWGSDDTYDESDDTYDLHESLGEPSRDSLGLGEVWYWRNICTYKGRGY